MQKYFNIFLEFNHQTVVNTINNTVESGNKGYVCVIDGNVLATSYKSEDYRKIINGGLVNTCDGSSIALLAGKIHKQKFTTYPGPAIFAEYVKQEKYKQYFIGNTKENHEALKDRFRDLNYNFDQYKFEALPFLNINDFNYPLIAKNINDFSPDIIWISLGAPKQEYFIRKLFPLIRRGVLIAIGAAFNLYLGNDKYGRAPFWMRKMHVEWIYRVISEPYRIGKRALDYALVIPRIVIQEKEKMKA